MTEQNTEDGRRYYDVLAPAPAPRLEEPETPPQKRRIGFRLLYCLVVFGFLLAGILIGLYFSYAMELPEVQALETYQPSILTEVYDSGGQPIGQFYLERRRLVSYGDIPEQFKQAVIAIEDKSFYQHMGIDPRRIIQSGILNLWHMKVVRGASTITQQLSKLLFLTPEVSLERKIKEAILAIQIEKNYPKDRIFTFYANKIYLAHGNYGIASAAEYYFNKVPRQLNLPECALLAALIKSPREYSPILHPDKSLERRNVVLREMADEGYISAEELKKALVEPIRLSSGGSEKNFGAFFVETIRQHLQRRFSNRQIFTEGLKVYTTLDRKMQESAEKAVRFGLLDFERRKGWRGKLENALKNGTALESVKLPEWETRPTQDRVMHALVTGLESNSVQLRIGEFKAVLKPEDWLWTGQKDPRRILHIGDQPLVRILSVSEARQVLTATLEQDPEIQGAFLALENRSGAVRAMVGGYDWDRSKFNRSLQAKRQTGSIFKPFVYTAAILSGMSPDDTVMDAPYTVVSDTGEEYSPQNYNRSYRGRITLRRALAESINIPAVRTAVQVGLPSVVKVARKFGITSPLHAYPSLALGAFEVTLVEMVSAFSAFPNEGMRAEPYFITRIEDQQGNVLEQHQPAIHEAIPTSVAHKMVSMLQGVVQFGTAAKARALKVPLGGKTGTTNDYTDTWFIGFTPSLTAGAWVGYDAKVTLGSNQTGAKNALPIWMSFMKEYLAGRPSEPFPSDAAVGEPGAAEFETPEEAPTEETSPIIEEDLSQ